MVLAFRRLIKRFEEENALRPQTPPGPYPTPENDIERVKSFFLEHPKAHIKEAVARLNRKYNLAL